MAAGSRKGSRDPVKERNDIEGMRITYFTFFFGDGSLSSSESELLLLRPRCQPDGLLSRRNRGPGRFMPRGGDPSLR